MWQASFGSRYRLVRTNSGMIVTRRTVLGAAPLIGAAAIAPSPASAGRRRPLRLADAVIDAFRRHRVVAVGEIHGQQEHHDAIMTLLLDPRLPSVADDIVVEFGNALDQPTMDRFVSGAAVEDRDLRLIWRNTTQSPGNTWDSPMYEQFLRTARAAGMRVLLGDPPVDWAVVTRSGDLDPFRDRNTHTVSVVRREVIDRGRRALICYGTGHVSRDGDMIPRIEQAAGSPAYVIVAGGHPRLAAHPRRTVIAVKGTWLESADSSEFSYFPGERGMPFGMFADALLYLGPVDEQAQSLANPAVFLDPDYWTELQRRNAIRENPVDLEQYRQEQSVRWPAR